MLRWCFWCFGTKGELHAAKEHRWTPFPRWEARQGCALHKDILCLWEGLKQEVGEMRLESQTDGSRKITLRHKKVPWPPSLQQILLSRETLGGGQISKSLIETWWKYWFSCRDEEEQGKSKLLSHVKGLLWLKLPGDEDEPSGKHWIN